MCAYNLYFFIYLICKEQHRTQQIQVHIPSSFSDRKGQWPNISMARKQHFPLSVLVLKVCPAHTWVYLPNTTECQNQYESANPNINKWFLQLNKD